MPKGTRLTVVVIIVLFGLIPPALYWFFLGRVPTVSAYEAAVLWTRSAAIVDGHGVGGVVVDIRTPEEYEEQHIAMAFINWPYAEIMAAKSPEDVPLPLRTGGLYLLCSGGIGGARATQHLLQIGVPDVYNVRGGMDEWIATETRKCMLFGFNRKLEPADKASPFYRESPPVEQFAAIMSGFVIKSTYMLLSLVLALLLLRRREADLSALRWGLFFFFVGEAFCAVNYAVFEDGSYLSEYLHGYPMALAFGFTTFAFFEGFDRRIIKYSPADEKCAALSLCRACIKYAKVPCGLRRVFLLLIPASIVLAFMPLCGQIKSGSYNTSIYGTLYNYSHAAVYQIFENQYCPRVAMLLFWVSLVLLLVLRRNAVEWSKVFFAAGSGALGFSLLRWGLVSAYWGDLVWFAFWEEMTELLYIAGVAYVLWVFREGLFTSPHDASQATG